MLHPATVVLMQSPNNSAYSEQYFSVNLNLPIVCEVTPMVTTLEVHYNQSGLADVTQVLEQTLLPYDSWPLASVQGVIIWAAYLLAQGPHSNLLADGLLEAVQLGNATVGGTTPVLVSKCASLLWYAFNGQAGAIPARNL